MKNESSTTISRWRARPVFISSTFKDMHAERDYLKHHVFPRLEEELRKRHHHLEPIDLRLGVDTLNEVNEEARELLVLKVCLDEIKDSRPFLIVMLGDRYGSVPPNDRIAAAAKAAEFQTDLTDKSVTALEIEFGILREDPNQKRRSLFYFRDPLPYDEMQPEVAAQYSDEHSPNPQAHARYTKLQVMKAKLADDPELGPRVHSYTAKWDKTANKVAGLEAWGEQVFQHLWKELDEETHEFAAKQALTWEELERDALAEFVEHLTRDFAGRESLIKKLLDLSYSPAIPAKTTLISSQELGTKVEPSPPATWGACVTGESGSGKSSLFARLIRDLEKDPSILLLANAAGISERSSSVDAMLRRWIQELAASLDEERSLPEDASAEDVNKAFASLLGRASAKRRVVVLVDALNQFEPTPRAKHLTWLPRPWPPNARIIATSLPGQEAETFVQWPGTEIVGLQPLTEPEARQIAEKVWRRYHRDLNSEVFQAIAAIRLPDGKSPIGNPLWLSLAMEQLNLLDADDFLRAEHEFPNLPEAERLHALLMAIASTRLPPEVEGVCDWLLKQTEIIHGEHFTIAFADLITLSRFGWREMDLISLVPKIAKLLFPDKPCDDFDTLKLASLRRAFRGQLVRRGWEGQWNFSHAKMRSAVLQRNLKEEVLPRRLNSAIAGYLLSLPPDDPLAQTETMFHLLKADDRLQAAHYYGGELNDTQEAGATKVLASHILSSQDEQPNAVLAWVISLLQQPGVEPRVIGKLCNRFNFALSDSLATEGKLSLRLQLLEANQKALTALLNFDSGNLNWLWNLSVCQNKIGYLLEDQGRLDESLREFQAALGIRKELIKADPGNHKWQRDLAATHANIGGVLLQKNDGAGALREFEAARDIDERLVTLDRSNASWLRDLSKIYTKIATVLERRGQMPSAMEHHRAALAIAQRFADNFPHEIEGQRELSICHERLGNLLAVSENWPAARREFEAALSISRRLVEMDPGDLTWQWDLTFGHERTGQSFAAEGKWNEACKEFKTALTIAETLALKDPDNAQWQEGVATYAYELGFAHANAGRLDQTKYYWIQSLQTLQKLRSLGMQLNAISAETLEIMETTPWQDALSDAATQPTSEEN